MWPASCLLAVTHRSGQPPGLLVIMTSVSLLNGSAVVVVALSFTLFLLLLLPSLLLVVAGWCGGSKTIGKALQALTTCMTVSQDCGDYPTSSPNFGCLHNYSLPMSSPSSSPLLPSCLGSSSSSEHRHHPQHHLKKCPFWTVKPNGCNLQNENRGKCVARV